MSGAAFLNVLSSFQQVFFPNAMIVYVGIIFAVSALGMGIVVFKLLFEYQAWCAVPEAERQMNPGLAVALEFVPIFSLYWHFRSIRGLSIRTDEALARRGLRETAPVNLGTFYCVYMVAFTCLAAMGSIALVIYIFSQMNFRAPAPAPITPHSREMLTFTLGLHLITAPMQLALGLWAESQCRATHQLYGSTENPTKPFPRIALLFSCIALFFFSLLLIMIKYTSNAV